MLSGMRFDKRFSFKWRDRRILKRIDKNVKFIKKTLGRNVNDFTMNFSEVSSFQIMIMIKRSRFHLHLDGNTHLDTYVDGEKGY